MVAGRFAGFRMAVPPVLVETTRTTVAPASLAFCSDGEQSGWVIATATPRVFVTLDWLRDDAERVAALIVTLGDSARIVPIPGSYFQLSHHAEDWMQGEAAALPGFVGMANEKIYLRAWEWRENRYEPRWVDLDTGDVISDSLAAAMCCKVWSLKVPVGQEDAVLHTFRGG
jgi:hypothetical protein